MTEPIETPGHYDPGGPVQVVFDFLALVMNASSFDRAWDLLDDNMRLCRAQAWLWNNREHPLHKGRDLDKLAAGLIAKQEDCYWLDFEAAELRQLHEAWGPSYASGLGAGSQARPIGIDLELVLLAPATEEPVVYEETTLIEVSMLIIVRLTDAGWRIASYSDFLPEPGWPPVLEAPKG